ncbi:MAG TPA: alkaline phosphatase family protein, partial [Minicystis sp.]|nr:alkaline phosphatase family protein [Minicystis sp.]
MDRRSFRASSRVLCFVVAGALGCGGSGDQQSGSSNTGGAGGTSGTPSTTASSGRASSSQATTGSGGTGGTGAGGAGMGGSGAGGFGAGVPYPIQHVVVIVKENHTFDNYFGSFPGANGTTTCTLKDGSTFPCPHAPDSTPRDLCHQHSCALTDWNGGQNNGWEDTAGSDQNGDKLAWAQYQESDIPN